MITVDKEIELFTIANGIPWVYLEREKKNEEREGPVTLFGSLLWPMGLNVLGYRAHLCWHRYHPSWDANACAEYLSVCSVPL